MAAMIAGVADLRGCPALGRDVEMTARFWSAAAHRRFGFADSPTTLQKRRVDSTRQRKIV